MIHFCIAFILSNLENFYSMKTLHVKTSKLCERLFKLERQGRYEEALSEIGDLWKDPNELPQIDGLSPQLAAELVLRCASIYGFYGHNKHLHDSQEKSKNLLTFASKLFSELGNVEKVAECENYLALSYWRKGEVDEAKVWLETSLAHDLSELNQTRIYTHIIEGLVMFDSRNYREIINLFAPLENNVRYYADFTLKGAFYNLVGNCWENLGKIDEALENLIRAKNFYQKAKHYVYYGVLLNDLAFLQTTIGNFETAHEYIDAATGAFRKMNDRSREGYSLDTKARIYLAEGKYSKALITIDEAISILSTGENYTYQVGTLNTKTKILVFMNEISPATFCLVEAVEIAKSKINEKTANNLVKDYESYLRERLGFSAPEKSMDVKIQNFSNLSKKNFKDDFSDNGSIELVLPSPLSKFEEIQGIWINNSHLEEIGIMKNSLAVIVPTNEIKRGDLIAVEEKETQSVSCGFYDNAFGIICLEGYDAEPLLFDEEKIRVIGKIVGVANNMNNDGKLLVEPI